MFTVIACVTYVRIFSIVPRSAGRFCVMCGSRVFPLPPDSCGTTLVRAPVPVFRGSSTVPAFRGSSAVPVFRGSSGSSAAMMMYQQQLHQDELLRQQRREVMLLRELADERRSRNRVLEYAAEDAERERRRRMFLQTFGFN